MIHRDIAEATVGFDGVLFDLRFGQREFAQLYAVAGELEAYFVVVEIGAVCDAPLHLEPVAVRAASADLEGLFDWQDVGFHAEAQVVAESGERAERILRR